MGAHVLIGLFTMLMKRYSKNDGYNRYPLSRARSFAAGLKEDLLRVYLTDSLSRTPPPRYEELPVAWLHRR